MKSFSVVKNVFMITYSYYKPMYHQNKWNRKIKQLCLFVLVNKRLDEWVAEERLDTRKVQYPRKDQATTGGVSTPKKVCHYTKINLKII